MFVRLPFVKQESSKDCGICCLQMIVRYYHGNISKEKLRTMTHTTDQGTSAYDLVNAAKKLQFSAYGVKGPLNELKEEDLPCIAHVIVEEKYHHYVVIYKMNEKKLLIADPSSSFIQITREEFEKMSSQVFILLVPKKKIVTIEEEPLFFHMVLSFLQNYKKELLVLFFFSLFIVVDELFLSLSWKCLLEYGIEISSITNLEKLTLIFILIYIMKYLFSFYQFHLVTYIDQSFEKELNETVFTHLTTLPYLYYRNHKPGELLTKMLETEKISNLFSKSILLFFINLPMVLLLLLLLGSKKIEILFFLFFLFALELGMHILCQRPFKMIMGKGKKQREKLNSLLTESFLGVETIQAFHVQKKFQNRFKKEQKEYQKLERSLLKNWNFQLLWEKGIHDIGLFLLLVHGMHDVIRNHLSIGTVLFLHALAGYILQLVQPLFSLLLEKDEAREVWENLKEVLNLPKEKLLPYKKNQFSSFESLKLVNISYSYNEKTRILKNLSLSIYKKDRILMVGKSGGGKSTLSRILAQILEPEEGEILWNEKNRKEYPLSFTRQNILYLAQNSYLFSDSVMENISWGEENREKVLDLGKLCYVDEIVNEKKEGYQFPLEENGMNLSGGERNRILIARALATKASIYIFDESFSELDSYKERQILENIFTMYPDKTFIVISHRESNEDLYTRKIKVKEGAIIEETGGV